MENEDLHKIRVLLIEDDEDDFVLTESLLGEIGANKFTLDWVTDYDAAMSEIERDVHDVCLLDYHLGAHTGLELLRDVRAKGYTIPIILLTGQGDQEVDVEAMKAGASDYLIKGQLDAALLERSIRYALEQKRIEEERLQHVREQAARAQAEAANRAKDEFLAMVSHELRTPLNAMIGWVRLLRMNKGDGAMLDRAVEAIERNAQLQSKFIEDLLDVTRIVNNNLRLELHPVEMNSLLETCVNAMRPMAEAKNVRLKFQSVNSSEIYVSADPDRLQQIISNLLSNAVKFTPENGLIETTLTCDNSEAVVAVRDTGIGIDAEFLPHIFDRYRQADMRGKRHGGLGLGLAITHSLVELHNGSITAESTGENQGSIFTVRLPLIAEVNCRAESSIEGSGNLNSKIL